jgi:hypothetical protein
MMPILIMPEADFHRDPPELERTTRLARRRSPRWRRRARTTEAWRAAWRARMGIADPVVIVVSSREVYDPPAGEASLDECEALLKALIRRKRCELSRAARAELAAIRTRPAGQKHGLSAAVMTWVLWAMSWYGTSTPHSLFTPILHPPTLLVQWWTAMPTALRFGPARELPYALRDCASETYLLWARLSPRLRARRLCALEPTLLRIECSASG